jgi:hypothetical protein
MFIATQRMNRQSVYGDAQPFQAYSCAKASTLIFTRFEVRANLDHRSLQLPFAISIKNAVNTAPTPSIPAFSGNSQARTGGFRAPSAGLKPRAEKQAPRFNEVVR